MQTVGDRPFRRVTGDLPLADQGSFDGPLVAAPLGMMRSGLEPITFEMPLPTDGLRPVSFTDGLVELDVQALRLNGARAPLARSVGNEEQLRAAARRASELGLLG